MSAQVWINNVYVCILIINTVITDETSVLSIFNVSHICFNKKHDKLSVLITCSCKVFVD